MLADGREFMPDAILVAVYCHLCGTVTHDAAGAWHDFHRIVYLSWRYIIFKLRRHIHVVLQVVASRF